MKTIALLALTSAILTGCADEPDGGKSAAKGHRADQSGRALNSRIQVVRTKAEHRALAAITKLGGTVKFDRQRPGKPIISVDLHQSSVTDSGLSEIGELTRLETLNLGSTQVTDDGLAVLKQMADLEILYLNRTDVSDTGIEYLVELKNLRVLYIKHAKVTDRGVQHLQAALPNCSIVR